MTDIKHTVVGLMTGAEWLANWNRVRDVKKTNDSIRERMAKKGLKATEAGLVKYWEVEEADRLVAELTDTYR